MALAAKALPIAGKRGIVLTTAVLRAADRLGLSAGHMAKVIGVSPATVSRMRRGGWVLEDGSKPFELAALLVRVFRSLDAIAGGDEAVVRSWMTGVNTALGGRPADKIRTIAGLMDVIAYLDARRAIV
tara:strand:+ start:584 stop:967 length:384 start_codon:yes stop_codon:yes gene_type:complete